MDEVKNNKKGGSLPGEDSNQPWWQPAILMFARLSGWIAIPVLIGAILGRWLDKKYDSEPWLFLVSVGVAFIVSMAGLIRNTMEEYRKIEKENQNNKKLKK
jgi:F0F1-type ATP synthase assembly protein I